MGQTIGQPRGDRPAPPRARRPGAIRVGQVLGVPVFVTVSWIVLSVVVIIGYGRFFGNVRQTGPTSYLLGAGVVVFLLVSVLLHELGHALTARRFAVGVRGITLELLGGFTEMDRDAPTPRAEAAIALAGPAVSLVLAGIGAAFLPFTGRTTVIGELAFWFALSNLIVAVFNVLPGLPLDGGRALRAGMWGLTRDPRRADIIAGWCGRVVAGTTAIGSLVLYLRTGLLSLIGVLFMLMISATLWNGAGEIIRMAEIKRRLPDVQAGRMARPLCLVASGTPLAEALRQRDEADGRMLGVTDSAGHVIALVSGVAVAAVPPERRPWVDVDSVARTVVPAQRVPAEATGMAVLEAVQANPGHDLLVTVGEDVIGVLRVADVILLLESKGDQ